MRASDVCALVSPRPARATVLFAALLDESDGGMQRWPAVAPFASWLDDAPIPRCCVTDAEIRRALKARGVPDSLIDRAMGVRPRVKKSSRRGNRLQVSAETAQRLLQLAEQRRKTEENARNFKLLCTQRGLPLPIREYQFAAPERRWQADFAFVEEKILVEVEGGIYSNGRHVRGTGYKKDMEKYSWASTRGWTVIRVAPDDLCTDATISLVRSALAPRETETP